MSSRAGSTPSWGVAEAVDDGVDDVDSVPVATLESGVTVGVAVGTDDAVGVGEFSLPTSVIRDWALWICGATNGVGAAGTRLPSGSGSVVGAVPPDNRLVTPWLIAPGSPRKAPMTFCGGTISENAMGVAGSAFTRSV